MSKSISVAEDNFNCNNYEQLSHCKKKLNAMFIIDTGGLPYETYLVNGKPYLITTNIDVEDGLANGAIGILDYIEYFENNEEIEYQDNLAINEENEKLKIKRLWLRFDNNNVGLKARRKAIHHITKKNIPKDLVPIERRNANIYFNKNRTLSLKRNHFPIVSACSMTIYKAQGGTYEEIVYMYDKRQEQQLVYVALSRVRSINGLFIVTKTNEANFYHGRRISSTSQDLINEFKRLKNNSLITIQEEFLNCISNNNVYSFITYNCQS